MIAFGCSITEPDQFRRCAEPGIRRAAEPGLRALRAARGRLDLRSYNATARPRRRARRPRGARARPPGRRDRRRRLVRQGARGAARSRGRLVGCVGALGVRSIAWWEGSVTLASFINRYEELGGGDLPRSRGRRTRRRRTRSTGEVETLDGFVLVLLAVGGAQHPLRRVARPAPRLRPRLLPAGPRGRPQGRHRRLPRHPPPRARDAPRPRGVDRGPHRVAEKWDGRMPRVGTGAGRLARAGAARRGRARRRRRAGAHEGASSSRRAPASSGAASPRRAGACRGG